MQIRKKMYKEFIEMNLILPKVISMMLVMSLACQGFDCLS